MEPFAFTDRTGHVNKCFVHEGRWWLAIWTANPPHWQGVLPLGDESVRRLRDRPSAPEPITYYESLDAQTRRV